MTSHSFQRFPPVRLPSWTGQAGCPGWSGDWEISVVGIFLKVFKVQSKWISQSWELGDPLFLKWGVSMVKSPSSKVPGIGFCPSRWASSGRRCTKMIRTLFDKPVEWFYIVSSTHDSRVMHWAFICILKSTWLSRGNLRKSIAQPTS